MCSLYAIEFFMCLWVHHAHHLPHRPTAAEQIESRAHATGHPLVCCLLTTNTCLPPGNQLVRQVLYLKTRQSFTHASVRMQMQRAEPQPPLARALLELKGMCFAARQLAAVVAMCCSIPYAPHAQNFCE